MKTDVAMYALSRAGTEKAKVFLAQGMETKRQMMLAHARLDDAMERLRLLTAAGDDTEEKKQLAGMMQKEEEAFLRHLCSLLDKEKEIKSTILKVPEGMQRTMLEMRYVHHYSYFDIAEKMQLDERHIYRVHNKALKAAALVLAEEGKITA